MGIAARKRVYRLGRTKALVIPYETMTGKEHTMAQDYLILSDPRGKIPEYILHEILEKVVEPELIRRGLLPPPENQSKSVA